MYQLRILEPAIRDLERLSQSIQQRIVRRLDWLAESLDQIRPEALRGDLSGLYKFRVGDYRIIYEIIRPERLIVIHFIGHRRDVYRNRS